MGVFFVFLWRLQGVAGKQTVCGRNANKVAWQLNPGKDFLRKKKKKKIFQELTNFPPFFGFFGVFFFGLGFSSLYALPFPVKITGDIY